jgi:hypothetical protein
LSYHRASEAAATSGATPVTVCTNDLALCNLVEDALPLAIPDALSDAELLVAKVVELEDNWIALAAVHAGMLPEIGEEIPQTFSRQRLLSTFCLIDISPPMDPVMLLLVVGPARSAVVVPLAARFAAPGEISYWLPLAAASASPHADKILRHADVSPIRQNARTPRGVAQSGSALGWGPSGRRFKSCLPDSSDLASEAASKVSTPSFP